MNPDIQKANRSARNNGVAGRYPIVPQFVEEIMAKPDEFCSLFYGLTGQKVQVNTQDVVLDFGCGPFMSQVKHLRNLGYKVNGYDFGLNIRDGMVKILVPNTYGLTYASNVLNVATSDSMLDSALSLIKMSLKNDGIFVFNYPNKPRYLGYTEEQILDRVKQYFRTVYKKKYKSDYVFICAK